MVPLVVDPEALFAAGSAVIAADDGLADPNVTKVVVIDPETGAETTVVER